MNIEQLEETIRELTDNFDSESFIYDLLLAYELPKASITRLRKGTSNLGKDDCDLLWKNRVCYVQDDSADLHELIDRLKTNSRVKSAKPRFVIATDGETLLASDMKTDDSLETPVGELAKHFDFFLPWAGMEKSQLRSESVADIRAAEKMGRLYDLILASNPPQTDAERHSLNVFLSRLLFCFFAEDTRIFAEDQFTKAIDSHTASDGSDLQQYLTRLFKVLAIEDRSDLPKYLADFPYVNGGLFCDDHPVPSFDAQSRKIILECGSLNWRDINPDIFGSMIQAVVHTSERGNLGIHYTSVSNIMKVIEPLFLNDLRSELEKAGTNQKKLESLLERLYRIRVFDPACGSGNFLIIAYKELSKLEIEIFKRIYGDQQSFQFESKIQLTQFYGIEIDGFAAETAKLSLWLAEHQMNLAFESVFGSSRPTLPLQDGGHIVNGNATRMDWNEVCPLENGNAETFVLGNPPYLGARNQSASQKADVRHVLSHVRGVNSLDYITCWFSKSADYIRGMSCSAALVTTNSLTQGEQVAMLWPHVLCNGIEIGFAHEAFKWSNNARGNAGVTCVVIGIRNVTSKPKFLISGVSRREAKNISPYLTDYKTIYVNKQTKPLSNLPKMAYGNQPVEGGNLILSNAERESLLDASPSAESFLRPVVGGNEFLKSISRWCLWIEDSDLEAALAIPEIARRINETRKFRESGGEVARSLTERCHQFRYRHRARNHFVLIPRTSSEEREYIPAGFFSSDYLTLDSAQIIYDAPTWVFGVLSSRIHLTWVRAIAGCLESRIRYSNTLCYNTFPFPRLAGDATEKIEEQVFKLLDCREGHPEKTVAQLYDPEVMPSDLRNAHKHLDEAVEECYGKKRFVDDEERLRYLFRRYEELSSQKTAG